MWDSDPRDRLASWCSKWKAVVMPTAPQFRQAADAIEDQLAELRRVRTKLGDDQSQVPIEGTTLRTDVQVRYEEIIEMGYTAENGLNAKIEWLRQMEHECFAYSMQVDEYYKTNSDFVRWPYILETGGPGQGIAPGGCDVPGPGGPGPWDPKGPGRDDPNFPQPPYPWVEASWIG